MENKVGFLYDLVMIFSQKFIFSGLFYSHLLAIWIFFTPSITSASTADGKAMEGMALYQKQKFNQASKKFLEARQGKPNDPKISYNLGLNGKTARKAQEIILKTYKAFVDLDAQMIEINPLVVTKSGEIVVIDCKMTFDENSLYRQRLVEELRDDDEMDALELEASRHNLNYVKLEGNIGLMVNGAGLSMATMDIIKHYGGKSANFMDVTGAASPDRVAAAFKLIYSDQDVKGILVNIFGGMMRCDDIAKGLIAASREVGLNKPLVVRLEGTNIDVAKEILKQSKLPIQPISGMDDAAKKIVESVKDLE